MLVEAYRDLREMVSAELMMQTHARDLYSRITYAWDDAARTTRADLSGVGAALGGGFVSDPAAAGATLADFARTVRGLAAEEMMGYWQFRERFAARDAELGWAMDSAGAHARGRGGG